MYDRISAFTGLPTIIGWDTHEWLWRSGALGGYPESVRERKADVQIIYTSLVPNEILYYLKKYDVSYVYLGRMEKSKYGTENWDVIRSLGEIIYDSLATATKDYSTTLIRIDQSLYESVVPVD